MTQQKNRHNAFTLMEMLIVITIIAILASVMIGKFSQVQENGWATACKGNLRSLYLAAQGYQTDNGGNLPYAAPFESHNALDDNAYYYNYNGWVTWTPTNLWKGVGNSPNCDTVSHSGGATPSIWYGANGILSIQSGSIWPYTENSMSAYCCPKFRNLVQGAHPDVVRSYVMNAFFTNAVNFSGLTVEASRLIMFADMQNQQTCPVKGNPIVCQVFAGGGGDDGVLDAIDGTLNPPHETIGYIHHMGGTYVGHVIFVDGHIEAVGLVNQNGTWINRTHDACTGQY